MKYSDLETDLLLVAPDATDIGFVADGEGKLRSPWYDKECKRRDPRDIASNLDMNPAGAGEMFFNPDLLLLINQTTVREPDYEGEVEYVLRDRRLSGIRFRQNAGRNRFKWWGPLRKGRPIQEHNYIVAADISLGVGASNSVAAVYDVNTSEKCGMFVSPDVPPEEFADQVVAICHWVGGATHRPFLIWEANGPGGSFDKRVSILGYSFVYISRRERGRRKVKLNRRGW